MNNLTEKELPADVIDAIKKQHKIKAIKLLRMAWNIDLKEAKTRVDQYITENKGILPAGYNRTETGLGRFALIVISIILIAFAITYLN